MVIVTHGALAVELRKAAEHVVGPMSQMATICIGPDDDLEQASSLVRSATEDVNTGKGVLLLTDMFGGTPSNLCIGLLSTGSIEVIAGVNLPMLIKLSQARETESLAVAAKTAKTSGRHYIAIASEIIAGNEDENA
ncbi:MAG: PTS fructose transporter subunit IIA [Robiginitomaculum sp.]